MILKDTSISRLIYENVSLEKTASKSTEQKYVQDANKISESLIKVASLPYKEEVYNSVQEIMKIASECIKELKSSNEHALGRLSELEKAANVRVLAEDMIRSGVLGEDNLEEKVAELMSKTAHELDVTREALKLAQQSSASGNSFFELEKEAGNNEKTGMFDGIIG